MEGCEGGVITGGDQAIQSHTANILQHFDGVNAAWILTLGPHVSRIVLALRACRARRREGPVIGVLDPTIGGIEEGDGVFHRIRPLPFGPGVSGIPPRGVVELWY